MEAEHSLPPAFSKPIGGLPTCVLYSDKVRSRRSSFSSSADSESSQASESSAITDPSYYDDQFGKDNDTTGVAIATHLPTLDEAHTIPTYNAFHGQPPQPLHHGALVQPSESYPEQTWSSHLSRNYPCSATRVAQAQHPALAWPLPPAQPGANGPYPSVDGSTYQRLDVPASSASGCHRSFLANLDSCASTQSSRHVVDRRFGNGASLSSSQSSSGHGSDTVSGTHPRRSLVSTSWNAPSLVRQDDKRKALVEQLVESASQLVAVIWPTSTTLVPVCQGNRSGASISLQFFVRETLKRSRTSYNSLQVALYYLILMKTKARLPCSDFTKEQSEDNNPYRSMQCGRRMLLSALILASKYLQDRNFSARAWSKISGLKVSEITSNEMAVLDALDWKLHVTENEFSHWSTIVLRCTETVQLGGDSRAIWRQVTESHAKGASIEAIARALRSSQPQARPTLQRSLPSWGYGDVSGRTSPACREQEDRFTPQLSNPSRLASLEQMVQQSTYPPPAPRLGSNLTTPSSSSMSSDSRANSPAAGVGPYSLAPNSGLCWTAGHSHPPWMSSPKPISSDAPDEVHVVLQRASNASGQVSSAAGVNCLPSPPLSDVESEVRTRTPSSQVFAMSNISTPPASQDAMTSVLLDTKPLANPDMSDMLHDHVRAQLLAAPPACQQSIVKENDDVPTTALLRNDIPATRYFEGPLPISLGLKRSRSFAMDDEQTERHRACKQARLGPVRMSSAPETPSMLREVSLHA